jgi:hypothetical protein
MIKQTVELMRNPLSSAYKILTMILFLGLSHTQIKLLKTSYEDHNVIDQLLIRYSAFIRCCKEIYKYSGTVDFR